MHVIKRHERHGFKVPSKRWIVERNLAQLSRNRCSQRMAIQLNVFIKIACIQRMVRLLE